MRLLKSEFSKTIKEVPESTTSRLEESLGFLYIISHLTLLLRFPHDGVTRGTVRGNERNAIALHAPVELARDGAVVKAGFLHILGLEASDDQRGLHVRDRRHIIEINGEFLMHESNTLPLIFL